MKTEMKHEQGKNKGKLVKGKRPTNLRAVKRANGGTLEDFKLEVIYTRRPM